MARIEKVKRPGPVRWLRYSVGAALPPQYDAWVFHDTTSRTWVLRHVARAALQLAPFMIAVLAFVPGPFWVRGVAVIGGTAMGLLFCLAYAVETTDRRLTKAGYGPGLAEQVRRERADRTRTEATARRRAKRAARFAASS
jgi:hypothetical protein